MEIVDHNQCSLCSVYNRSWLFTEKNSYINPDKVLLHLYRGEKLFNEGHPADCYYCIRSGRLIITRKSKHNQEEIISIAEPGELLGIDSITNNNQYNCTAMVLEDCFVCKISKEEFKKQENEHPEIVHDFLKQLSKQSKIKENFT